MLTVSRKCLDRVVALAMAWHLTADPKFLKRAEREMLASAGFPDWNPAHFLDVAEMTAALAIGYDWLYCDLDHGVRDTIRSAILNKGLLASFVGGHRWVHGTNNWNQVCNGGLVLGALALAEEQPELAAKIINRALESLPAAMSAYAPDGAYPEGPTYWGYGSLYSALMVCALETALGSDFRQTEYPGFLESTNFMAHSTGPTGLFHNYSDARLVPEVFPAMFWFAEKARSPQILWHQAQLVDGAETDERNLFPLVLLWSGQLSEFVCPEHLDWHGQGPNPVAFFRSGWDRESAFVGIKAGSPGVSHGHMDAGSFVFDSGGVRWVVDPGIQDYASLGELGDGLFDMAQHSQRWQIFRMSNHSHSTLQFGDGLQNVSGFASLKVKNVGGCSPSASINLSEIYREFADSVTREIRFDDRRSLRICDAITGARCSKIIWQIPTLADLEIMGKSVGLSQSGRSVMVAADVPGNFNWSIVDVARPRSPLDAANPGLKLLQLRQDPIANASVLFEITIAPEDSSLL